MTRAPVAAADPQPVPSLLSAAEDTGESAFRRQVRTQWFAWIAALEEGDAALGRSKTDEILKQGQRYGVRRLTDFALAATVYGRQKARLGKPDIAREAYDAAVRLDPDLPEVRWNRLALALSSRRFGEVPREILAGAAATIADESSRRIALGRAAVLLAITGAGIAAALSLLVILGGARRLVHDCAELAGRVLPAPARTVAVGAILLAPILLSLDVVWLVLFLFVVSFGYAGTWQKVGASVALLLALPLLPVLDRTAYTFDLDASPIIRGAEALEEARFDQRVVDGLEAAKNVLPDDAEVRFLLARLYQLYGQNDKAVGEYSVAAEISREDSRSLVNRGAIRFIDGDFGPAQVDFEEAVKRDARNVAARFDLSLVYAETFQTKEASQALHEARAIDARSVQRFQDSPKIVKIATVDYTPDEARRKVMALASDPRGRRLPGQFRDYRLASALKVPLFGAVILAIGLAIGLDAWRGQRRGYAQECQKCGRTFCRRCKPPGESAMLCSQCVHVYLRKDGVAIETKLQKVEEVRQRKSVDERLRYFLNVLIPGAAAFREGRPFKAILILAVFLIGLLAALAPGALGTTPRPGDTPGHLSFALWLLVALSGWAAGQVGARRQKSVS